MKKFLHLITILFFLLPFSVKSQCPDGQTEIVITVTQDRYGDETTWELINASSEVIVSGGPYSDLGSNGTETHVVDTCVVIGEEVTFVIRDSYGDGICSGYGNGWYTVEIFDFVFAEGCDIGKEESTTFLVETPPNVNAVIEKLDVPSFIIAGDVDIVGEFSNKGVNDITSIDINWSVNGGCAETQNLTGLSIATNETFDFTHDIKWSATDILTTNNLKVWLSNPNETADEVLENDTIEISVYILDKVSEKRALIEHFTNASCAPCASQNPALSALLKEKLNEWQATHIAYHTSWPGVDPMYSFNLANNLNNARVTYYGVTGVPNAVLSGNKFQGSPTGVNQAMIDEDWGAPGLFDVIADLTYANDSVYVDVQLKSLADFSAGEIVVHTILTEDLEYSSAPGTNGEKEFPDVMRYMFPDVNGEDIGLPSFDDEINLSYKHIMDDEVSTEMGLVVFVQNNVDKEVYAVYQLITDISTPNISFNVIDEQKNIPVTKDLQVYSDIAIRYDGNIEIIEADTIVFLRSDSIDGEDVPSTFEISDTKRVFDIKPVNDLDNLKTYYVGIKSGLEGYNGAAVEAKSVSFETQAAVGIDNIIDEKEILIYPNPTIGNLTLKLRLQEPCNLEIRVYDETGKLVKIMDKGKLVDGDQVVSVDLNKLDNGLYFINVSLDDESITKKIQIIK